jgi:hypothetical protein
MSSFFILNVIRSAPNPDDPLDATVAEHWTVCSLPAFFDSFFDYLSNMSFRETSAKLSSALRSGQESTAIAFISIFPAPNLPCFRYATRGA